MVDYLFLEDALDALDNNSSLVGRNVMNGLISIEQFECLLNFTPYANMERFRATGNLPETGWSWNNSAWSTENSAPASIKKEIMETGVCYMVEASRANQNINEVCYHIEQRWGNPTDCHLYFSTTADKINHFGVHKDNQHNIIAQVDGVTQWKVGTKVYSKEDDVNLTEFNGDDIISIDIELHPGDAIVVPAGVYHKPKNMSKRISASFAIAPHSVNCEDRTWIKW